MILSVLVRQDGLRLKTTLLATQVTSTAALSWTLYKPLFLHLHKLKVLNLFCSSSFSGMTFSPPTEALSQAHGSPLELALDVAQVTISASPMSMVLS